MNKKWIFIILAPFILSACESADGTPVPLPEARVNCDEGNCTAATGSPDAVVTLSRSGCARDQIDLYTVAVATLRVTCAAGVCTGSTSSWRSASGDIIAMAPSGIYDLCGWIDFNNNGKDAADAFSETSEFLTTSPLEITDWGAAYRFSREVRKPR